MYRIVVEQLLFVLDLLNGLPVHWRVIARIGEGTIVGAAAVVTRVPRAGLG
jgi:hypothetical protein